jgi:hypothetical protein
MDPLRSYLCRRATRPPKIDGDLDKAFWRDAEWTEDFVDIEGGAKPAPRFRTRAKMLWDDDCLYIGAELEEPHVWATLTEHDSVIFQDNDFEVFFDPDGDHHLYGELELNALNTTWDLLLVKPYRDGGPAINGWEIQGLQSAVHVRGTLNDPTDVDEGWSAEIALPFKALAEIARCPCPPRPGDQWRINFSRVQWRHEVVEGRYQKLPNTAEDNWVWSPQGAIDMHRPERWGVLQFGGDGGETLRPLEAAAEREALMRIYHAQRGFRQKQGRWAESLQALGLADIDAQMETTASLFEARIGQWRVDSSSRLTRLDDA